MKHIHIVGSGPRTGTTLMAVLMSTCFKIDSFNDTETRIFDHLDVDLDPGKILLSKHPRDITIVAPFLRINPDFWVIFMLRDPRDTITSTHKKAPNKYWASLRYWNHNIGCYKKVGHHPRLITIRYEELVKDPDAAQDYIKRKIPFLEETCKFSTFHYAADTSSGYEKAMQGIRPISDKSVGKWKEHLPRVAGQLKLHGDITPDLIEYGYEKDSSWLKLLEDVTPDVSKSHFPEYFFLRDKIRRNRGKYSGAFKVFLKRFFS